MTVILFANVRMKYNSNIYGIINILVHKINTLCSLKNIFIHSYFISELNIIIFDCNINYIIYNIKYDLYKW